MTKEFRESKTELLRQDLHNVGSIVSAARGLIKKGQAVNLEPLGGCLCAINHQAARRGKRAGRPLMMGLIDGLTNSR
jgi:hypothetical protein